MDSRIIENMAVDRTSQVHRQRVYDFKKKTGRNPSYEERILMIYFKPNDANTISYVLGSLGEEVLEWLQKEGADLSKHLKSVTNRE